MISHLVLVAHGDRQFSNSPLDLVFLHPEIFRISPSIPWIHFQKTVLVLKIYPGHVPWSTLIENGIQT